MKKFEIGKKYYGRFASNSECIFTGKVIARTDKTVTFEIDGEIKKLRICQKVSEYFGVETVYPFGQYSMAPSLKADREIQ